jgi:hypothetical protein
MKKLINWTLTLSPILALIIVGILTAFVSPEHGGQIVSIWDLTTKLSNVRMV